MEDLRELRELLLDLSTYKFIYFVLSISFLKETNRVFVVIPWRDVSIFAPGFGCLSVDWRQRKRGLDGLAVWRLRIHGSRD